MSDKEFIELHQAGYVNDHPIFIRPEVILYMERIRGTENTITPTDFTNLRVRDLDERVIETPQEIIAKIDACKERFP